MIYMKHQQSEADLMHLSKRLHLNLKTALQVMDELGVGDMIEKDVKYVKCLLALHNGLQDSNKTQMKDGLFGLCCLMTPGLSEDIRCHV